MFFDLGVRHSRMVLTAVAIMSLYSCPTQSTLNSLYRVCTMYEWTMDVKDILCNACTRNIRSRIGNVRDLPYREGISNLYRIEKRNRDLNM
jgi:hypothetical protein